MWTVTLLPTWQQLVVVCHAQEQRQVVAHVAAMRVHQDVPAQGSETCGQRPHGGLDVQKLSV